MNGAFYIGATGLDAQQRALEVVANNIANMSTTGFKRAETSFSEMVAGGTPVDDLTARRSGADEFSGVSAAPKRLFTQGSLRSTGNALDIAIDGEGFIELLGPDGETLLWRGGTLAVNRDGMLTTSNGTLLKANISVPDGVESVTIAADGTVSAVEPGETEPQEIGKIGLVRVRDMASISGTEDGLYKVSSEDDVVSVDAGTEGAGTLVQGSVENSNVALTDEMVSLLVIQRAYAANAQMVQAADQLMAIANGLRR